MKWDFEKTPISNWTYSDKAWPTCTACTAFSCLFHYFLLSIFEHSAEHLANNFLSLGKDGKEISTGGKNSVHLGGDWEVTELLFSVQDPAHHSGGIRLRLFSPSLHPQLKSLQFKNVFSWISSVWLPTNYFSGENSWTCVSCLLLMHCIARIKSNALSNNKFRCAQQHGTFMLEKVGPNFFRPHKHPIQSAMITTRGTANMFRFGSAETNCSPCQENYKQKSNWNRISLNTAPKLWFLAVEKVALKIFWNSVSPEFLHQERPGTWSRSRWNLVGFIAWFPLTWMKRMIPGFFDTKNPSQVQSLSQGGNRELQTSRDGFPVGGNTCTTTKLYFSLRNE